LKIKHDVTTPYHPQCNAGAETFNKVIKHYMATAIADAEASTLDWEAYLAPLLFSYNTGVSSSTKVTPFEAAFGYDPRVPLWEGVQYPGDEIVERKDFAEYLAQVKHTQLAARQIAHHNNQQTRTDYADKYDKANKVAFPMYVAGDKVWVRVMDKTQRTANPKLAPQWERGTIIQRGVTGTSYQVERHDRKRKKSKMINVQQIKPWKEEKEEEEEDARVQPPRPMPHASQQTPAEEDDSEDGDEDDDELPGVDLGQDEEEDEGSDQEAPEPDLSTPAPQEDPPLPAPGEEI
jgi:ribosomal protein L21E